MLLVQLNVKKLPGFGGMFGQRLYIRWFLLLEELTP